MKKRKLEVIHIPNQEGKNNMPWWSKNGKQNEIIREERKRYLKHCLKNK